MVRVCGVSWLLPLVAVTLSGCAFGRSNVSIDSNSRAPWMNLELMPSRKKESPANYRRSVSNPTVEGDSTVEIAPATTPAKKETRLADWLIPGSSRTPLPLPRSDVATPLTAQSESRPDWWGFE